MLDDNPFVGPAVTFGTELAEGKGINDATAKSSFGLGLSLMATAVTVGFPEVAAVGIVAYGISLALSIGFDWLYDHRRKK